MRELHGLRLKDYFDSVKADQCVKFKLYGMKCEILV